jgi:hypothetical protein
MLIAFAVAAIFSPPTVRDVAWIAGCWELIDGPRHIVEQWTPPEGATLMGVSRTVVNGKTTEYEFLLIRERASGLEYVAKPSGQSEATFTATRASVLEVVFENRSHDFPQRIIYRKEGEALKAAIEGLMGGQTRRLEFPYVRARCGG